MSDSGNMAHRSSHILRESKASQKIDDLKLKLADILKFKMSQHNEKANEYQRLEEMLTEGN